MEFKTEIFYEKEVFVKNGIRLTPRQTEILKMLLENTGQAVWRDQLIRRIWGETYPVDKYSKALVNSHICAIRSFLEDTESDMEIFTLQKKNRVVAGLILIQN